MEGSGYSEVQLPPPLLHLPLGQAGVSAGLEGRGGHSPSQTARVGQLPHAVQLPLHHLGGGLAAAGSLRGSRAGSPRPSCLCPQRSRRAGWAALSASWASALPLRSLPPPRSRLRPRPPGHSSLQVWVLALPVFRAPHGPWPSRRVSVGRPPGRPQVCARLLLVRLTQSRWREAGKPAPATAPAPGSCPTHRPARLGLNNLCTPLKGKKGSMLRRQRPGTGLSDLWCGWTCRRMLLPWTPSPRTSQQPGPSPPLPQDLWP